MVREKASRIPIHLCLHACVYFVLPSRIHTVYLLYWVFDDTQVKLPQFGSVLMKLHSGISWRILYFFSHDIARDSGDWQRLQTSSTSWMQMEGIPSILQDEGEEF